jgi:hypothetical protein
MSSNKEAEAEAFRKWFASQTTYSSMSAMERALNITEDYLHKIKNGSRRAIDPELRRKLREATGLKIFDQIPSEPKMTTESMLSSSDVYQEQAISEKTAKTKESRTEKSIAGEGRVTEQSFDTTLLVKEVKQLREKVDLIHTKLTEANVYQEIAGKPSSNNAEARARIVMRLLMSLSSELEFFKNCTENERKIFKKIVPGQDVGYITTLLRALYDEDKFQRWLLFSTYTMKGKENGD